MWWAQHQLYKNKGITGQLFVTQKIKSPLETEASHIRVLIWVWAAMVLIQLPASLPWKATRNLHQYWGPCCPWGRAGWSSCLQSLLWPSPNCYSLDSESVDDLSLSPACPLLLFQINTLLKKQTKKHCAVSHEGSLPQVIVYPIHFRCQKFHH